MEDLQSLLEKINRDGIEKADAEAKRIIAEAEAKAAAIVKNAESAAESARAKSEQEAIAYSNRAAETIQQAARDVVLGIKDSITALLENLLAKDVEKTLTDEKAVVQLITAAINGLMGPGEITCGPKLAATLKAQSAALKDFTLVINEAMGNGFSIKLDGGRIEHAFTTEVIAAELAKHLRPDLAKLLG